MGEWSLLQKWMEQETKDGNYMELLDFNSLVEVSLLWDWDEVEG